jgi:hypothetical protein
MNWYLSKIVFRIICGEGQHTPQFDEQLRLIESESESEAFEKATAIGLREQEQFYNQQRKLVQWKFINVAELFKLTGLLDGAELYSRIQETENADNYIALVNRKADHIQQSPTHQYLQLL